MRRLFALTAAIILPCFAAGPQFDSGKVIGGLAAPITIEAFSSFDCPHCKILHEEILPALVRDYVIRGKVCFVSREFPLPAPAHPYAHDVAIFATAAARIGKYQPVSDALFKNQASWAATGQWWETIANVLTAAEQKKVQALAKDPGVIAEVQRDLEEGTRDGINSTPTLFVTVQGRRTALPPGVPNYEFLKRYLDDSLK